jgi:CheY-like chemotaxis protein
MACWLIVEDEPDVHEMLVLMAHLFSHTCVAFTNGDQAIRWLDQFDSAPHTLPRPDIALIDARLPGDVQGDHVSVRLRTSPHLRRIPVLIMTAYYLRPDDADNLMMRSGADRLLQKPLPPPRQIEMLMQELIVNGSSHA